ncbi:hypothetical protein [Thiothrix eikelboomii]|uniref:Lipoprotein n=1 Tax=Thiothrix eikelboomii TaxID=92487 RepID=A0A1T4WAC4_9GAMM|nr:hypothetical protein [Thiothrix eikelboomii]SKA73988.1 hypothetical protein SAMN02745130_01319 [Thiothrix eikelboomii]
MRTLSKWNRGFVWVLVFGGSLIGCTTTTPIDEKRAHAIQMCKQKLPANDKIKLQSVSFGCMASMAFSKAIGSNNPAPLLCMAGGASGFLFGETIAERKCSYVTQTDQLNGEIAHAKKMNAGFTMVFAQQTTELSKFELMLSGLRNQQAVDAAQAAQKANLAASLAEQVANDQIIFKQAQEEFRFKQKTLADSKRLKQQVKEDELMAEIQALQKNLKTLQENNAKFSQLRQDLSEA